ncbi:IS3 family transposase [Enterococcus italicus]|uniref:IS3 family transposase n=1 Tax=Enterococcus italicus TaxID=246144 RepID=UPI0028AFD96F|nr:IS3 family transposase [Enterococcus italicus]
MKSIYAFICAESAAGHHRVTILCRTLKVSRASYYRWKDHEPTAREVERADLKKRIIRIFHEEGEGTYGAIRVHRKLKEELDCLEDERICSVKRVQKIMRELGLVSCHRKKWKPTPSQNRVEERPNLLAQDFTTTNLNQKWVTDITYIETKKDGWCYLSTILDLHSRKIIGYSFGKNMDTELIIDTLKDAVLNRKFTPGELILHSDLGSQYTSKRYEAALESLEINHSFSKKGCPYDNAGIESFHATIKKERIYQRSTYRSFEEAQRDVFDYIHRFYNRKRIHSSIFYLTPVQMEERTLAS